MRLELGMLRLGALGSAGKAWRWPLIGLAAAALAALLLPQWLAAILPGRRFPILWSAPLPGPGLRLCCAGADGRAFLASEDGFITEVSAQGQAGEPRRLLEATFDASAAPDGTLYTAEFTGLVPVPLPPGLPDEMCTFGQPYEQAYTLRASNAGGTLWEVKLQVAQEYSAEYPDPVWVLAWNGGVYFMHGDKLDSYSPQGKLLWSRSTEDVPQSLGWVGADGTLYGAGVLDPGGRLLWAYQLAFNLYNPNTTAVGPDGRYYLADNSNGVLICLDGADGKPRWQTSEVWLREHAGAAWPGSTKPAPDPNLDQPADKEGYWGPGYVGVTYRDLKGPPAGSSFGEGPVAFGADGRIFTAGLGNLAFGLNPDGSRCWQYKGWPKLVMTGMPVLGPDSRLYIASQQGWLCLSQSGKLLGLDRRFKAIRRTPCFSAAGRAYLINGERLLCLDTAKP